MIRIVGTQIWIGTHLFSEGLEGPPYAAKLREAESICCAMLTFIEQAAEALEEARMESE